MGRGLAGIVGTGGYVQLHTSEPPSPGPGWVTFAAPDVAPTVVVTVDVDRALHTLRVLRRMAVLLDEWDASQRRAQNRLHTMYRRRQLARRRRNRRRG